MNKDKRKLSLLLVSIVVMIVFICVVDTKASAGSVTDYQKITWGISTGRYYVNGIHAFCAQYNKSWPTVGTVVEEIVPCTNDVLRKALYYGYNGPQNTLGTDGRAHVLTAVAVSDANIGESVTGASSKYDAFYWELVNNPSKYPSPPSNFKAYMAITASDEMQNLAFYKMAKNGYVKGIKSSSNTELNGGNACYSLAEAQYGIYTQENVAESSKIGTLTTNAEGNTNTLELAEGTYYAYETVAPKGYAKSESVIPFTVAAEQTTTLTFSDVPQTNPIDILIKKVDAETEENKAQGGASLKGAQFTVCYYAGVWQENVDPASLGEIPKRTWVFETDEDGIVRYESKYQISGDALYASIPLGTIVIQETKASEGYLKNETIYVSQITSEGTGEHVRTYACPVIPEKVIEVKINKYQCDTEAAIPGTVFEHIAPDGSRNMVTTDEKGEFVLKGLQYGVHTLWEISVMEGYIIDNPIHTFVVDENTNANVEISIYNNPAPYEVVIHKCDDYGNKLSGAEFAIFEDSECQKQIDEGITDENGMLELYNLEIGKKYYLKETKAPAGYEIRKDELEEQHVYEIHATSTPVKDEFVCYVDGIMHDNITGTKAYREVNLEIKNDVGPVLPKTGSSAAALMYISGIALCSMSLYLKIKEKKQEKGEKTL